MDMTTLFIGLWAVFLAWFAFAMTRQESPLPVPQSPGNGELSPRSANWLLIFAFLGASLICALA